MHSANSSIYCHPDPTSEVTIETETPDPRILSYMINISGQVRIVASSRAGFRSSWARYPGLADLIEDFPSCKLYEEGDMEAPERMVTLFL